MTSAADSMRQVPLALLDAENNEWKRELEFCQDELAFFYAILRRRASRKIYSSNELANTSRLPALIPKTKYSRDDAARHLEHGGPRQ